MKFGVIGNNPLTMSLLQELAGSREHSLVVGAISDRLAQSVAAAQFPIRLVSTREDAMLDSAVDAVIIAVDDVEESLRLCRAATQADKNVVIIPPLACSPAFSFELHLILDESRHSIVPLTGRFQLVELPVMEKCLPIDRSGILQIAAEIPIENSSPESRTITILQGLDLLSASGFEYTGVTALESLAPDGTLLSLLITLNSQTSVETPAPPATLTIRPRGLSPLSDPELRIQRSSATVQRLAISERAPTLARIEWLFGNRDACSQWMESFSISLELAEAVKKSLRRRRTVDVHFDSGSERGVFKSQMTAMGCGVLTFMMFGMVAYLVIAQLTTLPDWVLHTARILWITPLVIFILAQALLPIARDRSGSK
jgi:hypothetical protein